MPAYVQGFIQVLQSPIAQQAMVEIMKGFDDAIGSPCQGQSQSQPKDHLAVAQNALDAYRNGHLTKDQAMKIVLICLQDDAAAKGQVIDISAKRSELAKLFN
jgi:hypothetical protein